MTVRMFKELLVCLNKVKKTDCCSFKVLALTQDGDLKELREYDEAGRPQEILESFGTLVVSRESCFPESRYNIETIMDRNQKANSDTETLNCLTDLDKSNFDESQNRHRKYWDQLVEDVYDERGVQFLKPLTDFNEKTEVAVDTAAKQEHRDNLVTTSEEEQIRKADISRDMKNPLESAFGITFDRQLGTASQKVQKRHVDDYSTEITRNANAITMALNAMEDVHDALVDEKRMPTQSTCELLSWLSYF